MKIPRSKYMATAERTEGTEGTETIHNEGTEIRRRTEKTELVGRRESDLPRQAAGDDEKPTDQNGTRCTSRFDLWVSRHRTAGLRPAAAVLFIRGAGQGAGEPGSIDGKLDCEQEKTSFSPGATPSATGQKASIKEASGLSSRG